LPPFDPASEIASLRKLTSVCNQGKPAAFGAFNKVLAKLLHLTIMKPDGHLTLQGLEGGRGRAQKLIRGSKGPIPLRDGRFLRLTISLYIEPTEKGPRFKTWQSSFQYQKDFDGKDWIFRYDYLRAPEGSYPSAHVQVRGQHERIHFPTMRVPFEAIIRCLANDFNVPCHAPKEVWRYILHHTELDFLAIHHPPISCPPIDETE